MANTYELIASVTANGSQTSIDFSSIPQTYTDLLVKVSIRVTAGGANYTGYLTLNGATTSYTGRDVMGNGSAASSNLRNYSQIYIGEVNGAASTSSTFTNKEIYIPNYAGSNYKSVSTDSVFENNATTAYAQLEAALWSNTAAITSLSINAEAQTLVSGSTVYLYGIKNS